MSRMKLIAAVLGTDATPAPVVDHDVPAFPLTERWAPSPAPRLDERGVTWAFLDHVARTTASAARDLTREDPAADVLVFAPGSREVSEIALRLRDAGGGFDVRELHGQIRAAEQDAVIRGRRPEDPPRIIVTTSLAESSLTVPGVRLVVDSCLARHPVRDAARGMSGLVTSAASRSSCVQRAGRATRQGPGTVIRCVDERSYAAAPARPAPEITTTDLHGRGLLCVIETINERGQGYDALLSCQTAAGQAKRPARFEASDDALRLIWLDRPNEQPQRLIRCTTLAR